jgi:uncharacterized delta-60 repeat protein
MRCLLSVLVLFPISAFTSTNGLDHRFGSNGALVVNPSPLSGVSVTPRALAIQTDGKMVIGGRTYEAMSNVEQPFVGRLNADGSWDATFGDSGIYRLPLSGSVAPNGGEIDHVAILSDGHILAAGGVIANSYPDFSTCILLVKTDASGALDVSFEGGGDTCFNFAPATTRTGTFEGILLDASDGFYLTAPANNPQGEVAHFDKDGALLSHYGSGGIADLPAHVYSSVLVAAGADIIAFGVLYKSGSYRGLAAVRLRPDGSLDTAYGESGVVFFDSPSAAQPNPGTDSPDATLDSAGRLIAISNDGFSSNYQPYKFFRINAQGSIDGTFNPDGQQPGSPGNANLVMTNSANVDAVERVRALADGRIMAFGDALEPDSTSSSDVAIIRLNSDSSFDSAFGDIAHPGWASINIGATGTSNYVRDVATDDDGRMYVLTNGGCFAIAILRLFPDTLLASGFDDESLPDTCPN